MSFPKWWPWRKKPEALRHGHGGSQAAARTQAFARHELRTLLEAGSQGWQIRCLAGSSQRLRRPENEGQMIPHKLLKRWSNLDIDERREILRAPGLVGEQLQFRRLSCAHMKRVLLYFAEEHRGRHMKRKRPAKVLPTPARIDRMLELARRAA
jgi:hypothetical protein